MAAEQITPMDELTGLPLPLLPNPELPSLPLASRNNECIADRHHPFHPRAALVSGSAGALAVRHCRVQWAMYADHHYKYHGAFTGPVLPETEEEQFKTVVMASAGYVPEYGIAFSGRRPVIKSISDADRQILWTSGQIKVGSPSDVRKFLLEFVLARKLDHVRAPLIDEFLNTANKERRIYLGHTLAALAVERATTEAKLDKDYTYGQKNGLIRPGLPHHPRDFIKRAVTPARSGKLVNLMTGMVAAA